MSDDISSAVGKIYRRRRKSTGATWTPANKSADKPDGVWCRDCKMRHGYMRCGMTYRKNNDGLWVIGWVCPTYGNVCGEQVLQKAGGNDGAV